MTFWTYILRCADGRYYVGHTDNLEARFAAHQQGDFDGWTRKRLPVQLVFSEPFETREQAFAVERQLKGWSRAKKQALTRGDLELLRELARSRGSAHGSTGSP
ncbi:MAG TPA: GIY-YIG nuclease family protein [Chloroflexota bacterium]|jgi:predicted GIY-YIG superfamily endonuclease|nr:GIY-YIG nuclease family protein [Chloroflexota bacterium]